MTLRFVPDPEREGELVPAYGDCNACRGHGTVIGGDEPRECPSCALRLRREYGPFVEALRELPSDELLAREAFEDGVDRAAKGWGR